MGRYRLRLHRKAIIWRWCWYRTANGTPFMGRKSGNDVEHDANAHETKNYTNLKMA